MVNSLNNITEEEMLNEHTLTPKDKCKRKMDEIFHELTYVKHLKGKKSKSNNKTTKLKGKKFTHL